MKTHISNIHGSHGSTFMLNLEGINSEDKGVLDFLRKQFKGTTSFYVYRVVSIDKIILQISFSEGFPVMAKVDHRRNHDREDLKYPVMVREDLLACNDHCKHYICHWCKEEVWGVQREAIEVYISKGKSFEKRLVSVHHECQETRERQIAGIPFP